MKKIHGLGILLFITFFSCSKKAPQHFNKLAASSSGITFKNELSDTPDLNILTYLYYYNGAGVAAGDFNNDTLIDLYFTSNQGEDKLYLNRGNLTFEDVTRQARINNSGNWTTGVTHIDINGDGLLDIYICKIGNYKTITGKNLLYVNQGINENGVPAFKEDAAGFGLDFSGFSTQAAFFDYDLDGDPDMYLMNHSVHPNRTYGTGTQRMAPDPMSGDRLYSNNNGKFVDVSSEAGIFQGKIGYGLGLGISDINNDGYPDIYVGNDFFENDYLYINQQNGTFTEVNSGDIKRLGHTTHFSMGNDIADINNDGFTDIISLDMLPDDLETYKTSGLEYPYPTYQQFLKNGYAPQFMQNTLHLNLGGEVRFSEIGNLAGISATEWSWGPLIADYDNDGFKDLFISNGIKGATNDMDFINFIANEHIQKRIDQGMTGEEMAFIDEMPQKKVPNYFFRNNGDLSFTDVTEKWYQKEETFSNGCVYADLDNDGDLDIIVNNVDEVAHILENKSDKLLANNYLKIGFSGKSPNTFGIGARVIAYTPTAVIKQENFVSRGYISAVPNEVHLGLGKVSVLDSMHIVWPNGNYETLRGVRANQHLRVQEENALDRYYPSNPIATSYLVKVDPPIDYIHKDASSIEFNRDPLIPFANTNEGPDISIADVNQDGLDDLFIGGAKGQAGALFIQDTSGAFVKIQEDLFAASAMSEDVSHTFFDANGDHSQDLLVVSGGNEFTSGPPLRPRLYLNFNGTFAADTTQFTDVAVNGSRVAAVDFDNDGDLDLTICSDQVPHRFGNAPEQYLFQNDGRGNFRDVTSHWSAAFKNMGEVTDIIWKDIDGNGFKDLIAVGHWIPITVFLNDGQRLQLQENNGLTGSNGWWNTVVAEDFDRDGDIDLVSGNWGTNSKLNASKDKPITLYSHDFDANSSVESLVTYFHNQTETPFASKDELVKQMPFLNKKFLSYKDFANASVEDLFGRDNLKRASQKKVFELRSTYYENDGQGNFRAVPLAPIAQASTIQDIFTDDFNGDGFKDLLIVGNNYEISTQLGRMDALHGLILPNDGNGGFYWAQHQQFDVSGPARNIQKIKRKGIEYYVISVNNDAPVFLMKKNN